MLLFLLCSSSFAQQQFTDQKSVDESNSLEFEKYQTELLAINNFISRTVGNTVDYRSNINQSTNDGTEVQINQTVTSNCNFVKSKPSTFKYLVRDDGELFIEVTVYGKCSQANTKISNVDIVLVNDDSRLELSKNGTAYLAKVNEWFNSKIKSDKNLYFTIFYEEGANGYVTVMSPPYPSPNKYNNFLKANDIFYVSKNEAISSPISDPLAKLYYLFSTDEFSYDLGTSSKVGFTKNNFFDLITKWSKSKDFIIKEIPIIIEE